ncbi:hypothetical protein GJAV_G00003310 [Gymnothorax javanicus]|nr:hypothetical protein GJAV_G00003310 [Gymnothorax javanicus]
MQELNMKSGACFLFLHRRKTGAQILKRSNSATRCLGEAEICGQVEKGRRDDDGLVEICLMHPLDVVKTRVQEKELRPRLYPAPPPLPSTAKLSPPPHLLAPPDSTAPNPWEHLLGERCVC